MKGRIRDDILEYLKACTYTNVGFYEDAVEIVPPPPEENGIASFERDFDATVLWFLAEVEKIEVPK